MSPAVVGVGVDHQDVESVRQAAARFGERYRRRWCTAAELVALGEHPAADGLGRLVAAKEAVVKALAPPPDLAVPWTDVEIDAHAGTAQLRGPLAHHAHARGVASVRVTHSVGGGLALALAVALGGPATERPPSADHRPTDRQGARR